MDPSSGANCDVGCNVTYLEHHEYVIDCKYFPIVLTENTRKRDIDVISFFDIFEFGGDSKRGCLQMVDNLYHN